MSRREAADALAVGEADLAIGYLPDLQKAGSFQQKLFRNDYVCIVRRQHPAIGERLTLKTYLAASHAAVSPDGREHLLEQSLQQRGLERRVVVGLSHFMRSLPLIESSHLVATVPRDLAKTRASVDAAKAIKRSDRFYPEARLPRCRSGTAGRLRWQWLRPRTHGTGGRHANRQCQGSVVLAGQHGSAGARAQSESMEPDRAGHAEYASRAGSDVFVFTGPSFDRRPSSIGPGEVWVPSYTWPRLGLLYGEQRGQAEPAADQLWGV